MADSNRATPKSEIKVQVGSPGALLAVVPGLLGFVPESSLVVVGATRNGTIRVTLRYDLPDPDEAELAAGIAEHAAAVLGSQAVQQALAVGYGPHDLVTPVADALRRAACEADIDLPEILRAENGRYWSYTCRDQGCCPSDGTPFDAQDHPASRALAEGGTVLATRAELTASIAPVTGPAATSMRAATRRAEQHVTDIIAGRCQSPSDAYNSSASRTTAAEGIPALISIISAYRAGGALTTADQVAWLTIALKELRVRDDAWSRMDPQYRDAHLRLWTDIVRRAQPGYAAAPASLLAFVAWQSGNGALANVALDRALADTPGYSMARLLRQALAAGMPPSMASLPMTPEAVAAAYDEPGRDARHGSQRGPCGAGAGPEPASGHEDERSGEDSQAGDRAPAATR